MRKWRLTPDTEYDTAKPPPPSSSLSNMDKSDKSSAAELFYWRQADHRSDLLSYKLQKLGLMLIFLVFPIAQS